MTTLVEVAKAVESIIVAKKEALGIADVFYGDQVAPRTPTVCIETGAKSRTLNGAPRRVATSHTVFILIYHNDINAPTLNREENDRLAESIEDELHLERTLGLGPEKVIHSLVTSVDPGYAARSGVIFQVTRLTLEADTQEMLPS